MQANVDISKPVVMYGNSKFSLTVLLEIRKHMSLNIAALTTDTEYIGNGSCGLSICDFKEVVDKYPPSYFDMIVAHGSGNMSYRKEAFKRAKDLGYKLVNYISPLASVNLEGAMGENNIISDFVHIAAYVKMGDNNLIRPNCYIGHHVELKSNIFISSLSGIAAYSTISDGVFIGIGTKVSNRLTVGENAIVGAGSVIIHNIEPSSTNVGVPSRRVK